MVIHVCTFCARLYFFVQGCTHLYMDVHCCTWLLKRLRWTLDGDLCPRPLICFIVCKTRCLHDMEGQIRWSVETSLQTEDQELPIVCSHKFTVVQLRQYYYSTLSYSYTRDICSCYVLLCWSDSHLLFPSKIPTKNNKRTKAVDSVFSCSSLSIGDTEDSLINWSLKEELELDQL